MADRLPPIRYSGATIGLLIMHPGMQDHVNGDIDWSENAGPPVSAEDFAEEAIFVICNSGMKNTVARRIYDLVIRSLHQGERSGLVFGHKGKTGAIDEIWVNRETLFGAYMALETDAQRLDFCVGLPWIGDITKFHLAKNFGVDVAKPDVHLQRLADLHGESSQALCERLAAETTFKARTIDLILWRACALGVINSRTGEIAPDG